MSLQLLQLLLLFKMPYLSNPLLLLLLLLQYLQSAQIQANSSQRRWCSEVGDMASWEGKRGEFETEFKRTYGW